MAAVTSDTKPRGVCTPGREPGAAYCLEGTYVEQEQSGTTPHSTPQQGLPEGRGLPGEVGDHSEAGWTWASSSSPPGQYSAENSPRALPSPCLIVRRVDRKNRKSKFGGRAPLPPHSAKGP